ncbi:MAG: hypothetical protein EBT33_12625 [Betaproteobacteria bacterium]|nr:hypothetical protein [Betaproteobacteria bacterium]
MARSTRRYGIRCCWKCWPDPAQVDGFTVAQINLYYPPAPGKMRPTVVTVEVTRKGRRSRRVRPGLARCWGLRSGRPW